MKRALDCIECTFKYFHDIGPSMLVAKVFFLSSDRPITKRKLVGAMTTVTNTHPLLRMRIKNNDRIPTWSHMDKQILDIREDLSTDWHAVFARVLREKYDIEKGPLWSLTLMPNARSAEYHDDKFDHHVTLVFGYLHSIANAGGILNMMNDLQDVLIDEGSKLNKPVTPFQIPKSIETLAKQHLSLFERQLLSVRPWDQTKAYFIKPILYRILPFINYQTTTFEKYVKDKTKCVANEEAETGVVHTMLNSDALETILNACKRHEITMHNACETAGNIALCEMIANAAEEKGYDVDDLGQDSVFVGLDYRRRPQVSSNDRQNYVAAQSLVIKKNIEISNWREVGNFWDLARQAQSLNRGNVGKHTRASFWEYTMESIALSDAAQYVKYFKPEQRRHLLGYTSNGNCNYLNRGPGSGIKIGGVLSGFGIHYYGWVFYHHVITVDNKMIWDVNYATNISDREFADKYLNRCVAILKEACDVVDMSNTLKYK